MLDDDEDVNLGFVEEMKRHYNTTRDKHEKLDNLEEQKLRLIEGLKAAQEETRRLEQELAEDLRKECKERESVNLKTEAVLKLHTETIEMLKRRLDASVINSSKISNDYIDRVVNTLTMRVTELESKMRDTVLHLLYDGDSVTTTKTSIPSQIKELALRIEQGTSARMALEQRLMKSIDDALFPLQGSILDEVNVRQTSYSSLQAAVCELRLDIDSDTPQRQKQIEGVRRLIAQVKEDVDKEIRTQNIAHEYMATHVQELRSSVERVKQELISNGETTRKTAFEEEFALTFRISSLEEVFNSLKVEIETELRGLKQTIDGKARHCRQGEDELNRRIDECVAASERDRTGHDALESLLKKEVHNWKQLQKSERAEVNSYVQRTLHAMDGQVHSRIASVEAHLTKEVQHCNAMHESFEKHITNVLDDAVMKHHHKVGAQLSDDAVQMFVQQARHCIEKDLAERQSSEKNLRDNLGQLLSILEPLRSRPEASPIPEISHEHVEDRPAFDLVEEARTILLRHLRGHSRIWGFDNRRDEEKRSHSPNHSRSMS